jgi:hypothetical protein
MKRKPTSRPVASRAAASPRGFVLVAALSLMMLLALVAIAMLSLSATTLRSASLEEPMAIARANARLALVQAISRLQSTAGPDQRSTATANLAAGPNAAALTAGADPSNASSLTGTATGLTRVQPGTRHWLGVWRNSGTPAQIHTRTPAPTLLGWLVSGTETTDATAISPAMDAAAIRPDGSPANPARAAILVGSNSASPDQPDDWVAAPYVDLAATPSSRLRGRYAWWIGDEGTKSRIDLPPPTSPDPTQPASWVSSRRGWETVTASTGYPEHNSAAAQSLPRLVSLGQIPLALAGNSRESGQRLFHAATSYSQGLLVDSLHGGLRVDLASLLAKDLPTANPLPTLAHFPTATGNIIASSVSRNITGPKWSTLKDAISTPPSLDRGALLVKGAAMEARVRTPYLTNNNVLGGVRTASIAPIVTDLRILMGVRFVSSGGGIKTNPCGKIAIAIANPYSVPLRWDQDLEFHLKNQTPPGNRPSRIWNLGPESAYFHDSSNPGEPAVFNNTYFRIRPDSLEPGEVRAYTHSGPTFRSRSTGRLQVDLGPFASSRPQNFSNCIELDTVTVRTEIPGLDVRESWQTTLVGLEMRLGSSGSGALLRAIDRFELDNGYFGPNTRNIGIAEARMFSAPMPLMLFSFSLSQPGMDYVSLLPSGYEAGQRGSTLRTFMDFNLRATRFYKPITSYNPPPYFMESTNSIGMLPTGSPGGDTGPAFTRDLAIPRWGFSSKTGPGKAVLFDLPDEWVSLAQLQHLDLTADDLGSSLAHQPAYAVGNSYASPFVKRSLTSQSRFDYQIIGTPNPSGADHAARTYYDLSYLLNAALWDSYCFATKTAPQGGPLQPAHAALTPLEPEKPLSENPLEVPAQLAIEGAFNVNSTEIDAWKALLASTRGLPHPADPSGTSPAGAAFPRSLRQPAAASTPPSGNGEDSYLGFRRLSDAEIDSLAREIVRQVRLRGPFVCLSHFVNRSIADVQRHPETTRAGALQAAIDLAGINLSPDGSRNPFPGLNPSRDILNLSEKQGAPRADMDGTDTSNQLPNASSDRDWAVTSTDNNFGSVASILADRNLLSTATLKREQGYRSTGIPGWLTQADVLQSIGPLLATRSDTFRIRTCGEALDASGRVLARAYCEAILQRSPEYLDPSNPPTLRGNDLNPINTTHGRRFLITSFRWLSPGEI